MVWIWGFLSAMTASGQYNKDKKICETCGKLDDKLILSCNQMTELQDITFISERLIENETLTKLKLKSKQLDEHYTANINSYNAKNNRTDYDKEYARNYYEEAVALSGYSSLANAYEKSCITIKENITSYLGRKKVSSSIAQLYDEMLKKAESDEEKSRIKDTMKNLYSEERKQNDLEILTCVRDIINRTGRIIEKNLASKTPKFMNELSEASKVAILDGFKHMTTTGRSGLFKLENNKLTFIELDDDCNPDIKVTPVKIKSETKQE
jgi:hypothetical protein